MRFILVGLGGFLGANARYLTTTYASRVFGTSFPYGTLLTNVTGSFLLGLILAFLNDRGSLDSPMRYFFVIGFLGAYTTFSTFTSESIQLLHQGTPMLAAVNILGSVILGLLALVSGTLLGKLIW